MTAAVKIHHHVIQINTSINEIENSERVKEGNREGKLKREGMRNEKRMRERWRKGFKKRIIEVKKD